MATPRAARASAVRTTLNVCLGHDTQAVGRLSFVKDGTREFSQFAYTDAWLADVRCFDLSPDLERHGGYQLRKPPTPNDSRFFLALADTEPDAWGRRIIARAYAKARAANPTLQPLTALDYLSAVDDFSRVGALRLRDPSGHYLGHAAQGTCATPALLDLEAALHASRAVELSQENSQDLAYLLGKATSLGGMRPKCTMLDTDGTLALGKFPSVTDERAVTRGEVLALRLARLAGINAADARIELVQGQPVAVIRRFDRSPAQQRVPYLSGATLLQARRDDEHAYTELLDVMRSVCADFVADARQLWRRLVFNHMITNVDDHLQNIGFLYCGQNLWRLAPAFDLNPFPDKAAESKNWLSEDTGPITSVSQLLGQAARFALSQAQAQAVLAQVRQVTQGWRSVALTPAVGMTTRDLADFDAAFAPDRA